MFLCTNSRTLRQHRQCDHPSFCRRRYRCSLQVQPRRPLRGRLRFLPLESWSQLLHLQPLKRVPASLSGPLRFPALVIAVRLRKVQGFVLGIVCWLSRTRCCRLSRPRGRRGRVLPRVRGSMCRCGSAGCVSVSRAVIWWRRGVIVVFLVGLLRVVVLGGGL